MEHSPTKNGYKVRNRTPGHSFEVILGRPYPRTIGFIIKHGSRMFVAERGHADLGGFETKDAAVQAIINEFERPC